jgi:two-component sensor histidine kinase
MLQQKALENSLAEKEILIKEVHHRVKNNMQVISSLLSIQAERAGDQVYSSLLNESQQRIKSMTLIHETLYQSKDLLKIDFQEYIESLTNSLTRLYMVPGVSVFVDVNVENVLLDLETAVPCGLVINELVSNSLKHAFHDKEETGIIDIDFVSTDGSYNLRIADNGVGLPSDFDLKRSTSMGLEIVTILTDQLEGMLSAYNDDGAVFQIQFPRLINE